MDLKVDPRYELYAAPRYRDFGQVSPGTVNSSWFDTHEEYEDFNNADVANSAPPVLADITNTAAAEVCDAAGNADGKPLKTKNIVTSWGLGQDKRPVKKLRTNEGEAAPRQAKAGKREAGDDVVPQSAEPGAVAHTAQKQRSRASHADGRRKSAKQRNLHVKVALMKTRGRPVLSKIMATRSTKQLTVPEEIELHTSRRAAAHGKDQVVEHRDDDDGESEGDTEDNKNSSPYKPLVLRVKEFDKTPGRFKRKPEELPPPKLLTTTEAKEPQLQTSARVRPSVFKPREVLEAEQMAQMPVFKASALNPLILSTSGQLGVPKVEKRDITAPQPFNFVTDDRAEARTARLQKQQQERPFERKMASDTDVCDKELPHKARKSVACHLMEPVVPRSPMLRTKFRARKTKAAEKYEFHARPVPKFLSVPKLELSREGPSGPTQLEPFRLATEERSARHRSQQEAKRAEEEKAAQRARVHRAGALPLSTDMPMVPPKPEPRGLTVPDPFNLTSEVRHQQYEEQKRRALAEEEEAKRAEAEFKARPMWLGNPFRLHEADIPLTVPEPVTLHTSARASTREEFNKHLEEKWKEKEATAKQAEEEARLREEEERRQLRKAAAFHALPMPDLSVPPITKPPPPAKPLTVPQSPALGRRKRRKGQKKREADA